MNYRQHFSTLKTPQSEAIPGTDQVANNAGGFAFEADDWKRLRRWLILGSEGGSYYVSEKDLTKRNAEVVLRCIKEDGARVVAQAVMVSQEALAPKNDPALFVLAMCAGLGDMDTRKAASIALPLVARIGTHLFTFAEYVEGFRGWGRGLRSAIAAWYNGKDLEKLAYQLVKYRQRGGWSHRDLLRLAHPKTEDTTRNAIYKWVVSGETPVVPKWSLHIAAFTALQNATSVEDVLKTLTAVRSIPWECIPTQFLKSPKVWSTLLENNALPMTAMLRNLGRMTANETIVPLGKATQAIASRLVDPERLRRARVHPYSILLALATYRNGEGFRGKLKWNPVARIVDALDAAFYLAFQNVEPTGKRIVLALDVSGSMGNLIENSLLTVREGAAAMAMVTARTEQQHVVTAFSDKMVVVPLSPRQRLDDIVRITRDLPFGGTDCALPMMWALGYNGEANAYSRTTGRYHKVRDAVIQADAFVIYTDHETWFGDIHPVQALQKYRRETGIDAKLIVVAMTSSGFTIADPNDPGMLDVVGFDASTPRVVANFIAGRI